MHRIADCVADGIRPNSSQQAAASKVKVIKKLPPLTPIGMKGGCSPTEHRLFPRAPTRAREKALTWLK